MTPRPLALRLLIGLLRLVLALICSLGFAAGCFYLGYVQGWETLYLGILLGSPLIFFLVSGIRPPNPSPEARRARWERQAERHREAESRAHRSR